MELQISVAGQESISLLFQGIGNRLKDFSPAFERMHQAFLESEEQQFASEGAYGGGWAALSAHYNAWKQKYYPGKPKGVLTEYLKNALTGTADGHICEIGPTEAKFGARAIRTIGPGAPVDYGLALHAKGPDNKGFTAGGWAKDTQVPGRNLIPFTEELQQRFIRCLRDHIGLE